MNEYYNHYTIFQNNIQNTDFITREQSTQKYQIKIDKLSNRNFYNNSESFNNNNSTA